MKKLIVLFVFFPALSYAGMGMGPGPGVGRSFGGAQMTFATDPNCIALYRLENGALTTDSKGSNTLTNVNTVAADTVNFQEGSASADFELADQESLYRTDADLPSDWPFKSGTSNDIISVTFWMRAESLPSIGYILAKYALADNNRSFAVNVQSTGGTLNFLYGYNSGANNATVTFGAAITTGIWYHIAITYNGPTQELRIRVWDDNAQAQLGTDTLTPLPNVISIRAGNFAIGSRGDLAAWSDGLVDQVAVFKDILTVQEIDEIRQGLWN
jgi:hypothetical protein